MEFKAPLYIEMGKTKIKKHYINLNQYRNWHFIVSNKIKKKYKELLFEQLVGVRFHKPIEIEFVLWKRDRRKIDRANPLSIHEKFFCDALTELGCIPDDNDDFIYKTTYRTGGINKENPHVQIIINEVNEQTAVPETSD